MTRKKTDDRDEPEFLGVDPVPPGEGHNSSLGGIAGGQLLGLIQRVERLEEDKAGIQADIKEVLNEAKAKGFNTKIMRQVITFRKMDPDDRNEHLHLINTYLRACGIEF